MSDQYSCISSNPSSPGSVSPNGSTGNQQPLTFQIMFHCTNVLFFIQWCSLVFHESSLPFLSNIAIWIKNFRGIHSCCDLEHMFQIMISFTFWFLSNDYFTLWPFGCSQDAQSLRICEAGHQIHQTSSSLPCDFITASRAGQKALFRITVQEISKRQSGKYTQLVNRNDFKTFKK